MLMRGDRFGAAVAGPVVRVITNAMSQFHMADGVGQSTGNEWSIRNNQAPYLPEAVLLYQCYDSDPAKVAALGGSHVFTPGLDGFGDDEDWYI